MFLSRLCKLKIVTLALLPYVVLTFGSEFLHNHGRYGQAGTSGCAPVVCSHQQGTAGLASAHSASDCGQSDCPACSWAKSNFSGPLVAVAIVHTSTISTITASEHVVSSRGSIRLAPSRAPPLG